MRKKMSQELRKYFSKLMGNKLPQFTIVKKVSIGQTYMWEPRKEVFCLIFLHINKNEDHFAIDLNHTKNNNSVTNTPWTRIQRLWGQETDYWFMLPEEREYQEKQEMEMKKLNEAERTGYRMSDEQIKEYLDNRSSLITNRWSKPVTDEEVAGIKVVAEQAMECIIKYAIPFFEKEIKLRTNNSD